MKHIQLGGQMAKLREPYKAWTDAGGSVAVTGRNHLRWMLGGKTMFISAGTSSDQHASMVRGKVRKHLKALKDAKPSR